MERGGPGGVSLSGFRGRWLVQDEHDRDAGFSISLWDSHEDAEAHEKSDFFKRVVDPTLLPFFSGEFSLSHCQVRHSHMA